MPQISESRAAVLAESAVLLGLRPRAKFCMTA
jgi:hypothetical protein